MKILKKNEWADQKPPVNATYQCLKSIHYGMHNHIAQWLHIESGKKFWYVYPTYGDHDATLVVRVDGRWYVYEPVSFSNESQNPTNPDAKLVGPFPSRRAAMGIARMMAQ